MLLLAEWAQSDQSTKAFEELSQPAARRAATELTGNVLYYSALL